MIPVLHQSGSQTLRYVQSPKTLLRTQIYPGPRLVSPAVWNRASIFLTCSPGQVCGSLKSEDHYSEKASKVVLEHVNHTNHLRRILKYRFYNPQELLNHLQDSWLQVAETQLKLAQEENKKQFSGSCYRKVQGSSQFPVTQRIYWEPIISSVLSIWPFGQRWPPATLGLGSTTLHFSRKKAPLSWQLQRKTCINSEQTDVTHEPFPEPVTGAEGNRTVWMAQDCSRSTSKPHGPECSTRREKVGEVLLKSCFCIPVSKSSLQKLKNTCQYKEKSENNL